MQLKLSQISFDSFEEPCSTWCVNKRRVRSVEFVFLDGLRVYVFQFFANSNDLSNSPLHVTYPQINIALSELPVTSKPSRCAFALASWLEERHRDVYPKMEGYNAAMATGAGGTPSFLNVRTPVKLPDALRGEQYAFVALPLAEFLPGGGVNEDTIGVGRLCPLPASIRELPAGDTFVQGLVLLTRRANAMATWLAGAEVVALQADLRKRVLTMETDIDTQYLMAKLNDQQRAEGAAFEQGKDVLEGLHFVSVQVDDESDPEGFWLLRELPTSI